MCPPLYLHVMDDAILTPLITGGAALLGALVGGLVTYFSAASQHKRQAKKELEDAKRSREQEAAKQCESSCIRMANDMETWRHPVDRKRDDDDAYRRREVRMEEAQSTLDAASLYLPDCLRGRVISIGRILHNAGNIAYGEFEERHHYHSVYTICYYGRKEIQAIVAHFLQGKSAPEPESIICEYQTALRDLDKERAYYYSLDSNGEPETGFQQAKEKFYKDHPELRPGTDGGSDESGSSA